ncbi:tryptophan synthase subunit alpha [Prochlorococcus sp. MIT 1223]|uniref:tryptophan synthase subunit alpha n=1 Tax=Prochlorococcus sp. MIT 1223 TaxID=3096217 RepID=UPI002A7599F4|nr:tryptophan synthase subunit alpha [Prochlorococcus sp. MIT 1223]
MSDNSEHIEFKTLNSSNISNRFLKIKQEGRIALMPFLMAGDPDLRTTSEILLKLQDNGADIVELGIPYSDPLADGPVIQLAASRALSSGTSPSSVLEMLSQLRNKLSIPVILFTYCNPLLNIGFERFCDEASEAGASGLVVPDLPLEEAEKFSSIASDKGLDLILLVAPTTPKDRMKRIAQNTKGFTYLVSVTGVTGERSVMDNRVKTLVQQLKESSVSPVAVGFGISAPKHIRQVRSWGADGAIVGSALVKRIASAVPGNEVEEAVNFLNELRSEV